MISGKATVKQGKEPGQPMLTKETKKLSARS